MTAPAVTVSAPTPVVAAPVVSEGQSFTSKLDSIIKSSPLPVDAPGDGSIPAGGVSGPPPVEVLPTREQVMAAVPSAGTTGVPPITAPVVPPVVPPVGPSGEIQAESGDIVMTAERNADGTFKTQMDPAQKFDIKIRDKESGETKVYSKTIPEVLRMAADGVWGQKVRDEVSYYRQNVPTWQSEHATMTATTADLRAQLDSQMALNKELLTADEALVVQRREEFAREMSPERELARLKEGMAKTEAQNKQTTDAQQTAKVVNDFAQARLAPAVAQAVALVGDQRAKEMLAYEMLPFQVNGQVPPHALQALEAHLNGPFLARVRQEAASKSAVDPRIVAAEEAARRAQADAQVLVNSTGRAMQPVGSVRQAGSDPQAPKAPPKNVNEAIERIINKPLAA